MVVPVLPAYLRPYLAAYKQWITTKPQVVSDIESTVRCLSYFTAGRFNNSSLASELIYSMPNLLTLLNDYLIYSAKYKHLNLPQFQSQIKLWLTIIEYTETLIEVGAKSLWGEKGKWLIIFLIQLLKSTMRLILVHHSKDRITQTPSIAPLNREKLSKELNPLITSAGFRLGRTGKMVRSVNSCGPNDTRIWAPLAPESDSESMNESPLTRRNILIAETLYIIKPLIHLSAFAMKGKENWIPWATALSLDLISLNLISKESKNIRFSSDEKEEIYRRRIALLLYILRSPFYDKCSKTKILSLLDGLSNNIPLARFVAEPLARYLPHWQEIYFYMWSR